MLGVNLKAKALAAATATGLTLALVTGAAAAPAIGEAAPNFTGVTSTGETFNLADQAGKTVILEWTNHDCPYVKKHYNADNMQALQRETTEDGAVWVTVISSASGKQGHVSADKANELTQSRGAAPSAVVLDEDGVIGRLYDAKTTPHMYVIDGEGTLRYMGAIDDKPSANASSLEGATNYVRVALSEMAEGKPVSEEVTTAYGCSVKY